MTQYPCSTFTEPLKWPVEMINLISTHSTEITLPAKKVFLDPGDMPGGVYYIRNGRTKHYILTESGSEKIIYTLASGWLYGETPVIRHEPTGLVSETMEPTTLWKIGPQTFTMLFDTNKAFRTMVMDDMARKMLIFRGEVEELVFDSVTDRILHLLVTNADSSRLIDGAWYPLKDKLTQTEIAVIVGSARVTTSKLINELCDQGKVRIVNRTMQISRQTYDKLAGKYHKDV